MIAQFPIRFDQALTGLCLVGLAGAGAPATAGTVELVASRPLDFGAIVVLGSGSKQIAPDGTVSNNGLVSVSGPRQGPAEFTLTYRPDSQTRRAVVQISVTSTAAQSSNGSVGTLAGLTSDLSGIGALQAGASRVVTLAPCPPPQCDTVFHIGGELTVSGGSQQATFTFPVQVTARLLAEL